MVEYFKLDELVPKDVARWMKDGLKFIYPTDSFYNLGCNASDFDGLDLFSDSFSLIAPSKTWIIRNFEVNKKYIDKLPGPFTYILKPKKKSAVNRLTTSLVGVRMPNHPFAKLIQKANVPFIASSMDHAVKRPITNPLKIPRKILRSVDIVVDGGILSSSPATVIDLTEKIPRLIR